MDVLLQKSQYQLPDNPAKNHLVPSKFPSTDPPWPCFHHHTILLMFGIIFRQIPARLMWNLCNCFDELALSPDRFLRDDASQVVAHWNGLDLRENFDSLKKEILTV
jgi:hypothetical protein